MSAVTIPYKQQLRREARAEGIFRFLSMAAALLVLALLAGVLISLCYGGWPALKEFRFGFLTQTVWNPVTERFGALAALYGTAITSLIAMILAVRWPSYRRFPDRDLSDLATRPDRYLHRAARRRSSIVFGIWGLFVLAPVLQHSVQPWLIDVLVTCR